MAQNTKTFRVATEGATCDGRELARSHIAEMAESYDPSLYGARINLEHFRGVDPDGLFKAYGDVTALEAREVEGKLALFATIEPTVDLIALSRKKQKIYSSIEVMPDFARTGKAYLVGMAITDSPASLGCEMLKFAASAPVNPLAGRKTAPSSLFTEAVEIEGFELEAAAPPTIVERVKAMFTAPRPTKAEPEAEALLLFAGALADQKAETDKATARTLALSARLATIEGLLLKLSATPEHTSIRPIATGAETALTDF